MVPPRAQLGIEEGQIPGIRISDEQRAQKPLRVLVQADDVAPLLAPHQAFQRLLLALQSVDGLRLLALFVDGEHQAAVQQLLIEVDGGGGQEDHDRAFHAVLMRDQLAGGRILSGRRDGQHALALQQLQRISRPQRALFFHDGEHLVLEIHLAHVEQRLARHGRVLHAFLFGNEGEHRIHQRAFPGGRRRLHQHRQRRFQVTRHGR